MDTPFDAIVVGGRCAGAATALRLARQGHRVLIVDQAHFPSDVRLSTHLIWHAGVDLLHKWGVLQALLDTHCPPLRRFSLDLGGLVLRGQPPGTQAGMALAPRRIALDQVLLDAAVAAGAQLRQGVTVDELLHDGDAPGGRVGGIRARSHDGAPFHARAKVVVGADGSTSRVAKAVGALASNAHPKEAGSYNVFAYFSGVPLDGVVFYSRPQRMAYAWQTNHDQVLVGLIQPAAAPRPARADLQAHVLAELGAMAPELTQALRAARLESDWLSGAIATFSRQAAGSGWCLVGDAGLTLDPITAAGITNALRDADTLGDLLGPALHGDHDEVDAALAGFQARRDAVSLPLHQFAQDMAALAPPTDEVMALFAALAGQQAQIDRYFGLFGQTVTPAEFFGPDNMARIMAAA